ncbi:ISAs1 family transposase [bacterium]|nr:ISAs1 family transposase [bacterium]
MSAPLLERLAELADPRGRNGRQYPLVPLLALCLVAILAGHTTPTAISEFGRLRRHRLGHAPGFTRGTMPCPNTITNLLAALDPDHLDRVIGAWVADRHPGGWNHLALDGKVVRGSRGGGLPGTHLLAAYAPHVAAVIAQVTVDATTNEHEAALRLLGVLPPLGGAVVTADARFTHADVCHAVRGRGGEYILYARGNQEALRDDPGAAFATPESGAFSPLPAGRVG